jgi:hypothetical protein
LEFACEALGGPGVAAVEVGDHGVEEVRGDGADRAQLIDGAQADDALADQLLRALRELENLHARRDPGFSQPSACAAPASVRPRSNMGRTALASSELLARDVLDRAVGILGLGVAHLDWHISQTQRASGGDPVKAGDELEAAALVANDDRDEHPCSAIDPASACTCASSSARTFSGTRISSTMIRRPASSMVLVVRSSWTSWPTPLGGRSPPSPTPARACHLRMAGRPGAGKPWRPLRVSLVASLRRPARLYERTARS